MGDREGHGEQWGDAGLPDRSHDEGAGANGSSEDDARLAELVADYVDRVSRGEMISSAEILQAHPNDGPALLEQLEVFLSLDDDTRIDSVTLGRLGDYELQRELGRGGMGVVYDAWQSSIGRRVALKQLPPSVAANPRASARFAREARAAGALQHPAIVPVFAMGIEGTIPYFAMEYVDGETVAEVLHRLRDRAEKGENGEAGDKASPAETPSTALDTDVVDENYARRIALLFAELADGVQHAHEQGVMHRDVKPSNIMVERSGRLRLLDFGLARLEGDETVTLSSDRIGTPLYMSPEQASVRAIGVDHRTDIYSLGVTLYEVLAWRTPFRGRDRDDTLSRIIHEDAPPPSRWNPRIPIAIETIVLKCLRKDPADRYATAEALAQDLRRFARGEPIEARPETPLERVLRRARQRKVAIITSAVIVALLAITTVLAVSFVREARRERLATYERRVSEASRELLRGISAVRASFWADVGKSFGLVLPGDHRRLWPDRLGTPLDRALEILEEEAVAFPDRPEGHFYLARGYHALGDDARSLESLRRCLERRPGFAPGLFLAGEIGLDLAGREPDEPWGALWLEASRRALARDWAESARAFSELHELDRAPYLGAEMEILVSAGVALLQAGEPLEASEFLIRAKDLDPAFIEPWLLLASAYFSAGHEDRTRSTFDRLHARSQNKSESALWIATTWAALGEHETALERTNDIKDPGIKARVRSSCYLYLNRARECLDEARAALAHDENDIEARMLLGMGALFVSMGQSKREHTVLRDEAITALRELGDRAPGSGLDALSALPQLLWMRRRPGDHEEALGLVREALDRQPRHPGLLGQRAMLRWYQGDIEGCVADCEMASSESGEVFGGTGRWTAITCAWALQRSGRPRRAIEKIEGVIEGAPSSAWVFAIHGHILFDQKRYREALEQYDDAFKREPAATNAITFATMALLALERASEAAELARQQIERSEGDGKAWAALGAALAVSDDFAGAARAHATSRLCDSRSGEFQWFSRWKLMRLLARAPGAVEVSELEELAAAIEQKGSARRLSVEELVTLALARGRGPARDLEGGLEVARRALESGANRGESLRTVAEIHHDRGEHVDAARLLERCVRTGGARSDDLRALERVLLACEVPLPSYGSCDRTLARIARGETDEAPAVTVEPLLDREPDVEGRQRVAAAASRLLGSFPAAGVDDAHEILVAVHDYLEGRLRALAGDAEGAAASFRRVLEADSFAFEARPRLADALWSSGARDEAREEIATMLRRRRGEGRGPWRDACLELCVNRWAMPLDELATWLGKLELESAGEKSPASIAELRWVIETLARGEPLRINAGGPALEDGEGRPWHADVFQIGGWSTHLGIDSIDPALGEVYRIGRQFGADRKNPVCYRVPLPDGRYRVRLHFAERHITAPGRRVFSVRLQGEERLPGYEPLREVGLHKPDPRVFDAVLVEHGRLDIELAPSAGIASIFGIEIERR